MRFYFRPGKLSDHDRVHFCTWYAEVRPLGVILFDSLMCAAGSPAVIPHFQQLSRLQIRRQPSYMDSRRHQCEADEPYVLSRISPTHNSAVCTTILQRATCMQHSGIFGPLIVRSDWCPGHGPIHVVNACGHRTSGLG